MIILFLYTDINIYIYIYFSCFFRIVRGLVSSLSLHPRRVGLLRPRRSRGHTSESTIALRMETRIALPMRPPMRPHPMLPATRRIPYCLVSRRSRMERIASSKTTGSDAVGISPGTCEQGRPYLLAGKTPLARTRTWTLASACRCTRVPSSGASLRQTSERITSNISRSRLRHTTVSSKSVVVSGLTSRLLSTSSTMLSL